MRIFQGVTGQAGQPGAIAKGLRALGAAADAGSIAKHKFGYEADFHISLDRPKSLERLFASVSALAADYDVFHFHARTLANNWPHQAFPAMLDLLALKERGKKVFFHYRGQEIRTAAEFSKTPYHYVSSPGSRHLFRRMPDQTKLAGLDFIRSVADGIFVTDPELQTYVPEATIVPRVLHADEWPFVGVRANPCPLVVHAPSRRGVKGTEAILRAVERLQERVNFRFKLIENLPHAEAKAAYKEADVVIDQVRIGWYGVLATETMALGKPTIAYIRDDLWRKHGAKLPIINANPDNIESVLENVLNDENLRAEKSVKSRDYYLATHASDVVCKALLQTYAETPLKQVDWVGVGRFMDRQSAMQARQVQEWVAPMRERAWHLWDHAREYGPLFTARSIGDRVLQRLVGTRS
jgi:hypothetical protein